MHQMANDTELNIDLGLAVLNVLVEPGTIVTRNDIAEVCGCTKYHIEMLEKSALAKFKRRARERGLQDFIE